jgi:thymidine kinase
MSLELYIGPMFAGKSSAILGILRRHAFIRRNTLCLTSSLDTRYSPDARIVSHNQESYPATALKYLYDCIDTEAFRSAACIIIEEAQFFTDLKKFALTAVEVYNKHVICVGLDGDSERRPFGQLLDLVPYADKIEKFAALCSRCADGTAAIFSHRKPGAPDTQVSVGSTDQYEALCRKHFLAAAAAAAPAQ